MKSPVAFELAVPITSLRLTPKPALPRRDCSDVLNYLTLQYPEPERVRPGARSAFGRLFK